MLEQVCWLSFALLVASLGSPTDSSSGRDTISNKGEHNFKFKVNLVFKRLLILQNPLNKFVSDDG